MTSVLLPHENALVLYHSRPARVTRVGEKLDLELEGGEAARVRPKDVTPLHPGPLRTLAELRPQAGDAATAWEILAGSTISLRELAELVYGVFSPATAWAAWGLALEGLYFRPAAAGAPAEIIAASADELAHRQAARAAEAAERDAWAGFVARAAQGTHAPDDRRYLREVEALAFGRTERSRVLRDLARAEPSVFNGEETVENAHAFLLEVGFWDATTNPHPQRQKLPLAPPDLPWPPLPEEARRDLTHLTALAIDDAGADVPDDALSWDAGRLWVHVADPAAVIAPDSALDLEARGRGATLYLPEGPVPMLPLTAAPVLGLGLTEVSPALSIGLDVQADGGVQISEIVASWVRVTRLTYEEAANRLDEEPLASLLRFAEGYEALRRAAGAIIFDLPETQVKVSGGEVRVVPIPPLPSRNLVENAMVAAGAGIAQYAEAHAIPLPYATQDRPDHGEPPAADAPLSAMYAVRRTMKRSQHRGAAAPHAGLGLPAYVQVTSPMRRYLDLVAHQQLRAHLMGRPLLDDAAILERVGAMEALGSALRQAERASEQHWTLVYLLRHLDWRGEGTLVERRGQQGFFILPELGWEASLHFSADLALDERVLLGLKAVDLPRLDARFRVLGG